MKRTIAVLGLLTLFVYACSTAKSTTSTAKTPPPAEAAPKVVEAPAEMTEEKEGAAPANVTYPDTLPIYQATAKMDNDIIHTKLDVRFDWSKQHVIGKAWVTAKPYFYPTSSITLDAQNFDIKKITMDGSNTPLSYTYQNNSLTVNLGKTFTRSEKFTLYIEYIAKPGEGEQGGSEAITSDKGLFFINPDGSEQGKPTQIWTQGETQSNSRWFPTFDRPNEKMTHEIFITVDDKYKTLSNGLMKASNKNTDGTRTDHWVMDMPHAPYLVMLAVGDFVIETEKWNGKDVMYYVEPQYKGNGKVIFKNVPEILDFFSKRLGVPYPWQKLANIAVRDYVSGAMENTTAIVYGEFMNGTERELIDKDYNEIVVAHEIFHHWFGDLVTTESWSNLTVNESFADYSEALWLEYKYGVDAADYHRRDIMDGYFGQAETNIHPLVHFRYGNREEMFDAHSYNKGGCILHMLRNYMGDEAFFEGLKKYLNDNAFKTGEAHQLRLALEEVSGEDLNWFFNQWYYKSGHPLLDISYNYDEAAKKARVTVTQSQQPSEDVPNVFELPVSIDIYTAAGQKPTRHKVRINRRTQTFEFDVPVRPFLVDFDGDRMLLTQKTDNHTEDEFMFMYQNSPKYLARAEAIEALKDSKNPKAQAVIKAALTDKFWAIRQDAVQSVRYKEDPSVLDIIANIAEKDGRSTARAAAISKLATTKDAKWATIYRRVLEKEPAYPVISAAMQALYKVDANAAIEAAKRFENDENADLVNGVSAIYVENPKPEHVGFFEKNLTKVDGMNSISFIENYVKTLEKLGGSNIVEKMGKLRDIGINQSQSPWRRFACAKAINDLRKKYKTQANSIYSDLSKMITEIALKETNEQLKTIFSQMITP